MNISRDARSSLFAGILLLLIPAVCLASFVGSSLLTNLTSYNFATDAAFTTYNDIAMLEPYEGQADSTGKVAHYIFGSDADGRYQTVPIETAGYDTLTVQLFVSNIGVGSTQFITGTNDLGYVINIFGSLYPAGYITGASDYYFTDSQMDITRSTSLDETASSLGTAGGPILRGFWSLFKLEPLAGLLSDSLPRFSSRSTTATGVTPWTSAVTVSGATLAIADFPRGTTTTTEEVTGTIGTPTVAQTYLLSTLVESAPTGHFNIYKAGIYKAALGGGIARITVSASAAAAAVTNPTTHVIIRVD